MSITDPAPIERGTDNTLNTAGEQTFPTPGCAVNPKIEFPAGEVLGHGAATTHDAPAINGEHIPHWNPPKYRDTHRRQVFTAGTILHLLNELGATHESHGVRQSVLMAELYKTNTAYNDNIPMRETLYTDGHDVEYMLKNLDRKSVF